MIRLELSEQETDYLYRCLMTRPMVEVETLVQRIRAQVQAGDRRQAASGDAAAAGSPAEGSSGPQGRPNGADPWDALSASSDAP